MEAAGTALTVACNALLPCAVAARLLDEVEIPTVVRPSDAAAYVTCCCDWVVPLQPRVVRARRAAAAAEVPPTARRE